MKKIFYCIVLFFVSLYSRAQPIPGYLDYYEEDYVYQHSISDTISLEEASTLDPKKLAVISGAGPAGLVAAATLKNKGYDVIVVEKKSSFSRMNLVNVNPDSLHYLKKISALDGLLESVASTQKSHNYKIKKGSYVKDVGVENISLSKNIDENFEYTPDNIKDAFSENAILSVSLGNFQHYFYEFNKNLGVNFLTNSTINIHFQNDVASISIHRDGGSVNIKTPDLIIIAEGGGSKTVADHIGWTDSTKDEKWAVSNRTIINPESFTGYEFVSDESGNILKVIIGIFNEKHSEVGLTEFVNHTVEDSAFNTGSKDSIELCDYFNKEYGCYRWNTKYFNSHEKQANRFSKGKNLIVIGDAAGTSSPIAGLGFSLAISVHGWAVNQLVESNSIESGLLDFEANMQGAIHRWKAKTAKNWNTIIELCQ